MWRLLNNALVVDVADDIDDNNDDAAENQAATLTLEHPQDWIFPSWAAYLIFLALVLYLV
jgi:hypothetical protein